LALLFSSVPHHTATPVIYALSLHDALPISSSNPVVDDATAHVAEALGLLHRLARSISASNPPKAAAQPTAQVPVKTGTTERPAQDRKSTRLNSSHVKISYAVFCLKKKTTKQ